MKLTRNINFLEYRSIKWILFTALSLTVPALFFLIQAVMFFPAVFFIAGIGYVIPKLVSAGGITESLSFIILFGIHALVYFGIYYLISVISAKLIHLIKGQWGRFCALLLCCLGLVYLTQHKVYGGGGHGPMRWHTLGELFGEIHRSYGKGTVEIIYGAALILLVFFLSRKRSDRL